jgi:hypothetical protein
MRSASVASDASRTRSQTAELAHHEAAQRLAVFDREHGFAGAPQGREIRGRGLRGVIACRARQKEPEGRALSWLAVDADTSRR